MCWAETTVISISLLCIPTCCLKVNPDNLPALELTWHHVQSCLMLQQEDNSCLLSVFLLCEVDYKVYCATQDVNGPKTSSLRGFVFVLFLGLCVCVTWMELLNLWENIYSIYPLTNGCFLCYPSACLCLRFQVNKYILPGNPCKGQVVYCVLVWNSSLFILFLWQSCFYSLRRWNSAITHNQISIALAFALEGIQIKSALEEEYWTEDESGAAVLLQPVFVFHH